MFIFSIFEIFFASKFFQIFNINYLNNSIFLYKFINIIKIIKKKILLSKRKKGIENWETALSEGKKKKDSLEKTILDF